LPLLGRLTIAWAMPGYFLWWLLWWQGLTFCPGWPGPWSSYDPNSTVSEMTVMRHHAQLFVVQMGVSHKLFCLAWPGTTIFPISASHVA
jgi:hypothetical protein